MEWVLFALFVLFFLIARPFASKVNTGNAVIITDHVVFIGNTNCSISHEELLKLLHVPNGDCIRVHAVTRALHTRIELEFTNPQQNQEW